MTAAFPAVITAAIVAVGVYLFFFVFFPIGRGAIYDPSSQAEAESMAAIADVRPGEMAADLGSGDGRVVCALARAGAIAHGYEINPILVLVSRRKIRGAGLAGRAFIHWGNFWRKDLSNYSLVTTFQVPANAETGQTIHVILEATDNGTPQLTRYQRVVVRVQ